LSSHFIGFYFQGNQAEHLLPLTQLPFLQIALWLWFSHVLEV